jgi:hypothetical protein
MGTLLNSFTCFLNTQQGWSNLSNIHQKIKKCAPFPHNLRYSDKSGKEFSSDQSHKLWQKCNLTICNLKGVIIYDDISLIRFVIPGSTKPAPYLIRGNPSF